MEAVESYMEQLTKRAQKEVRDLKSVVTTHSLNINDLFALVSYSSKAQKETKDHLNDRLDKLLKTSDTDTPDSHGKNVKKMWRWIKDKPWLSILLALSKCI